MSIDIKLSKAQLSKMIQSGGFFWALLGILVGPLMKISVPLAKNSFGIINYYVISSCKRWYYLKKDSWKRCSSSRKTDHSSHLEWRFGCSKAADLFGTELTPEEVLDKTKDKSIKHNMLRTQSDDYIMCGFYCIAFVEYMISGKTLSGYTISFSPKDY